MIFTEMRLLYIMRPYKEFAQTVFFQHTKYGWSISQYFVYIYKVEIKKVRRISLWWLVGGIPAQCCVSETVGL